MEISNLSIEEQKMLLEALLKSGKISEIDLQEAMSLEPTAEMKQTVDLVHSLMCTKSHGRDALGSDLECVYYVEEALAESWKLPTHKQWITDATAMMKTYNLTTMKDVKDAVKVVVEVTAILQKQALKNHAHFQFSYKMLKGFMEALDSKKEKGLTCPVTSEPKLLPQSDNVG